MNGKEKNTVYFADSPSGRKLEYRIMGRCAEDDPVLLYVGGMTMVGFPQQWKTFMGLRGKPGIKGDASDIPWKLVLMNRPGYGKSTTDGKLLSYGDVATDIAAVADDCSAKKFALLGTSSGGNYCLAAAAQSDLKGRVTLVNLNSADANYCPETMPAPVAKTISRDSNKVASEHDALANPDANISYKDGMALCRPGSSFCGSYCCCGTVWCRYVCCCPAGLRGDFLVEKTKLDFKYEDIEAPVFIYHGTKDNTVDIRCAHYHSVKLKNVKKKQIIEGMGHCKDRKSVV